MRKDRSEYLEKWRMENKEHINELRKIRYKNDPEKYRKKASDWRKENPEKRKESEKKWRNNNRDKIKENNDKKAETRKKDLIGRLNYTYLYMQKRTRDKNWNEIISKQDFLNFASNDLNYRLLFNNWVNSNYSIKLTPSIDRIDNSKGYIEGNLQFLTLQENSIKENIDSPQGREVKIILENKEEIIFNSTRALGKYINRNHSSVIGAIKRKGKCGGYKVDYV